MTSTGEKLSAAAVRITSKALCLKADTPIKTNDNRINIEDDKDAPPHGNGSLRANPRVLACRFKTFI